MRPFGEKSAFGILTGGEGSAQLLPLFAGRKFPDRIENVGGIRDAVFICAKLAVARGILPKLARIGAVSERMGADDGGNFLP